MPRIGSVRPSLFFPDGHALFDPIDTLLAGVDGVLTMCGTGGHNDRHFAQRQLADTVQHDKMENREFLPDFIRDTRHFFCREFRIGVVKETATFAALMVVTHRAQKKCLPTRL